MGAKEPSDLGRGDWPLIPNDWGIPGWGPEQFEAFNDARRNLHHLMQRRDQFMLGEIAVLRKEDL
jgi:hypothetical protein